MSGDDFTSDMYERIKQFIQERDCEVFIKVKTKETEAEMRQRIEQSAAEMERGANVVLVSGEEFENFLENWPPQYFYEF